MIKCSRLSSAAVVIGILKINFIFLQQKDLRLDNRMATVLMYVSTQSELIGGFDWPFCAPRFLARSTFLQKKNVLHKNPEALGVSFFKILNP